MATIDEVIPSLGSVPTTADPATFDARADTLLGTALPAFRDSVNVWAGEANLLGADVTTKSATATSAANTATGAAETAVTAVGNNVWVSGQAYAQGAVVWSPIDLKSYRAQVSTSGTTDPSLSADWASPILTEPSGWVLLSTVTASASATADIDTTFDSTYDTYVITATGFAPATNEAALWVRFRIGGVYVTSSYDGGRSDDGGVAASTGTNEIALTNVVNSSAAGHAGSLTITVNHPASTSLYKTISWSGLSIRNTNTVWTYVGAASNSGTAALTGVRFLFSAGNIAIGTFRLYGIRKV